MSGWVTVENYCFLGTNCSISNGSKIGNNSWISEGTSVGLDIPSGSFVNAANSGVQALDLERLERKLREKSSRRFRD
jgi:acyl-[acyl carrier protein]--UDP-N-acetylglucosamine O-acyltransferase